MGNQPFLTIGIPTFNRQKELELSLQSIYQEIGDSDEFQILVADNASTDYTEDVVKCYLKKYHNLTYIKRKTNIGADRNIFKVLEEAEGKYCLLHGDDDYFLLGTIRYITEIIKANPGCSVYFILGLPKIQGSVQVLSGMTAFLDAATYTAAAISAITVEKKSYDELECKDKFINSGLNQIYILYSLILKNNKFVAIATLSQLMKLTWSQGNYSFGETYIKSYLDILNYFVPLGLDADRVKVAKKEMLDRQILPNFYIWKETPMNISMAEVIRYFKEYYCDEPYYEEYLKVLTNIANQYTW